MSHTIFIADDDRDLLRLVRTTLEREGFSIGTAVNGADTVARVVQDPPDLLLLDYRMPDMTAEEVIEALAAHETKVPFIVMTGHGHEKIAVRMMKLGARDYLIKDTLLIDFLPAVVKEAVARIEMENRLTATKRELRDSEERFRLMFETSEELLTISDAEGRIMWANSAWRETLGYRPEELKNPSEKIHPEDREGVSRSWQVPEGLTGCLDKVQYRFRTAAGDYLHLECSNRKVTVGERTLWYAAARDITELTGLRRELKQQGIPGIVGRDPAMLKILELIRDLARVDVPVLVQGESGTGKELVAVSIHGESRRDGKPFVTINCGALPEGLIESELFGHVKGAFTGAVRDKKGRFEIADGGTIFLDEVGELSPAVQVKLLRVLQESTFSRVGDERTTHVDVRLISATNRDLQKDVRTGRFREDLFYRLNVVPVNLPPLRERPSDIPYLAEHILENLGEKADRRNEPSRNSRKITLAPDALSALMLYSWPGNVRELQNVLHYALVKCKGDRILASHLPPFLERPGSRIHKAKGRKRKLTAEAVSEALKHTGGNKVEAARHLGVSRATLYRFLEREHKNIS